MYFRGTFVSNKRTQLGTIIRYTAQFSFLFFFSVLTLKDDLFASWNFSPQRLVFKTQWIPRELIKAKIIQSGYIIHGYVRDTSAIYVHVRISLE